MGIKNWDCIAQGTYKPDYFGRSQRFYSQFNLYLHACIKNDFTLIFQGYLLSGWIKLQIIVWTKHKDNITWIYLPPSIITYPGDTTTPSWLSIPRPKTYWTVDIWDRQSGYHQTRSAKPRQPHIGDHVISHSKQIRLRIQLLTGGSYIRIKNRKIVMFTRR